MKTVYNPDSIRKLRRAKGLTKQAFGLKMGVSRQYIHQLEMGDRKPNVVTLERIMEAHEVDVTYFFINGSAPV